MLAPREGGREGGRSVSFPRNRKLRQAPRGKPGARKLAAKMSATTTKWEGPENTVQIETRRFTTGFD